MSMIRSRWAAIGAAVAVTLGVGGVSLTQAAISSGERPVYIALDAPCRLVDTRPTSTVGPKNTPIGAGEAAAYEIQVTGANGNCSGALAIPADATGVALNVTAIAPIAPVTGRSYFTVYPADAPLPFTSNLNFLTGSPPVPNKVDVGLSATGRIKIYNNEGTAHAAVDVFGYYIDHNHDDRYYTEAEVDTALADLDTRLGAVEALAQELNAERPFVWTNRDDSEGIGNTAETVVSVTVTAPASGNITVLSTITVREDTPNEFVGCSISDSAVFDVNFIQRWESPGAAGEDSQLAGVRVFDISAGQSVTYELVCFNISGGSSNTFDATMAAIFTPGA